MPFLKRIAYRKQDRTLLKYFLSYCLIVSVLVIGFFFLFKNQLTKILFENLSVQETQKLNNISSQMNDELVSISRINNALISNSNVNLSRYRSDAWKNYLAFQALQEYVLGNNILDRIVYLNKKDNSILSCGGYTTFKDGFFYIYDQAGTSYATLELSKFEDLQKSRLFFLSDEAGQLISSKEEFSNYLIYYPSSFSESGYSVFYILSNAEIKKILSSALSSNVVSIGIMDLQSHTLSGINTEPFSSFIEKLDQDNSFCQIDSETSAYLFPGISDQFALTAIVSNKMILHQVNIAFKHTYFIFAIMVVIGIILILIGMDITYKPLYKLTKKITKSPDPSNSYLKQLDHAFSAVISENQDLQNKIEQYRMSMQKSILDSVMTENASLHSEGYGNIDQFFNADSDNHNFVIRISSASKQFAPDKIANFLHQALPNDNSCIILEETNETATLLVSYPGREPEKEAAIYVLLSDLYEEYGVHSAISNSSTSPLSIPALYENAVLASSYWSENQPVISYSQIASHITTETQLSYPYKKLDELSQNLEHQDFDHAFVVLEELFAAINQNYSGNINFPDFFIRCILIDTITAFITAMNHCNIKFKNYNELYFETLYYCRSCPYKEAGEKIRANIMNLLELFRQEYENTLIQPAQIQQIIDSNYTSPDFSITTLADSFGISIAYMSYIFKKEFDENFSHYLWALRLEKAKKLLLETDLSIDVISQEVGYLNTSSFRRKFKQETGVTPSAFRSQSS